MQLYKLENCMVSNVAEIKDEELKIDMLDKMFEAEDQQLFDIKSEKVTQHNQKRVFAPKLPTKKA